MASLPSKLAPVSPVGEAPGLANERKTIVFRFTVRSGQPETDAHLSSKLRDKKKLSTSEEENFSRENSKL